MSHLHDGSLDTYISIIELLIYYHGRFKNQIERFCGVEGVFVGPVVESTHIQGISQRQFRKISVIILAPNRFRVGCVGRQIDILREICFAEAMNWAVGSGSAGDTGIPSAVPPWRAQRG
jgi:hypothetical protein